MQGTGWIVVERCPDGRLVRRSREMPGLAAEAMVVSLRARGRDALAMRFPTPDLARGQNPS